MGIGYVALGGFGAKCRTGWSGVDTPWTVMTTRAPAVLKIQHNWPKMKGGFKGFENSSVLVP